MTKKELFNAVRDIVQENAEHQKYSDELGDHYSYLKSRLPKEIRNVLDRLYFCTVAMESVVMDTAFEVGARNGGSIA